jgi:hypothetical protein
MAILEQSAAPITHALASFDRYIHAQVSLLVDKRHDGHAVQTRSGCILRRPAELYDPL